MRRRLALGGAVAVVVAGAAVWTPGCSLFGDSLDPQVQDVVDAVDARTHTSDPGDAARFVSHDLDVLLSDDVAGAVDADAMAELFDAALAHDPQAVLFGRVVAGVSTEGEIHNEALRPVLAEAATTQLAWVDERITAYFASSQPPAEVRDGYFAVRDFLREAMRDPRSAERLDRAVNDYAQAETARAPETGEPRSERLRQIGRIDALLTDSWYAAERDGPDDGDAIEADIERKSDDVTNWTVWVALDRFGSDAAVRASAQGRPFLDETGAIKSDLSRDEVDALREWAGSLTASGGLTRDDVGWFSAGAADVM